MLAPDPYVNHDFFDDLATVLVPVSSILTYYATIRRFSIAPDLPRTRVLHRYSG